jgi:NAD-dependent dihydropyrimidine dehydrogenase PreA subunit
LPERAPERGPPFAGAHRSEASERVLVQAPSGRDAELTCRILDGEGLVCHRCGSCEELAETTVLPIKRWSECSQCALCEKTCEWGAIRKRQILKTECVRCDDCEILYEDKGRCPHWLLELKRKARAAVTGNAA